MSNLLRILLFVPPMFLFIFPAFAQLSGTIEQNPINSSYTVSVIPSVTWVPPSSITSGAGITLRAPTGKLQVTDFQSITGQWASTGVFTSPSEAPDFDYFTFGLLQPNPGATYNSGVKSQLFTFKNSLGCSYIEIIDNQTDPLNVQNNSINIGVDNYFSVVGAGNGVNAYSGNSADDNVICPPLAFAATPAINPLPCNGNSTIVSVAVSGGKEPYEVTWLNQSNNQTGTGQISGFEGSYSFSPMLAGNYVFTVVDALDSMAVSNLQIMQPAKLQIDMLGLDVPCEGNMDGEVQVKKATGGTVSGSYHYNWDGFPTETDSILSSVTNGTYNVTVTDDNGCSATGSATVSAAGFMIFSQTIVKNVFCNGAENGLIDLYPVSPSGGQDFSFDWSSNANTGNYSSAYNLGPGTYSVTVSDVSFGCSGSVTYNITEPPAIEVDYRLTEPKCYGEQGLLEIMGISNAQGAWDASIIGGENVEDGDKFLLEPGMPMRLVVEDSKGCTASEDFIVAARQEMKLDLGKSYDIKYGEEIHFDPVYYPFDNVSFEWSPAVDLSCSDCPDPILMPTETNTYHLVMTDTAGCTIDDFVNVAVHKSRDIFIPNSFSPNQDGINDTFYPYGGFEIVAIHSMQVFDRWGGKMFEAKETFSPNDPDAGWDGLSKNKPADPGTYLYTMNVEFIDGEIILFSGEVNLMK
ncbi:MAG: T9SS type B sorting domain-containing protein [Bacteroidetes bacterium]|nr:T9SS type B sorting domain-containing protein [Bacteroidota bacterium]